MPTQVADIEMTAALTDVELRPGAIGLLALVRRQGRPVGMLRLRAAEGRIPASRLEAAIAAQVRAAEDAPPPAAAPVSIVVCTRDRPEKLDRCLEALRVHAAAGHEIVVVDNAPSDGRTASVVASYPYRHACEPVAGLNHARNRGVAEASRDIVAFTDDDCVPDCGWVDALASPFRDPKVAATTGLIMPLELETEAQERFEAYCANRRTFVPRVYRAPATAPSTAGVTGTGANMAVRREWLDRLGGFDPRFDGGTLTLSGGDTELFARVLAAGGSIAYRPDALVWHCHQRELAAVRRVVFGYGVGISAVLWKRFREDADRRAAVTALRWLGGPPLKALWNRLRGRPAASADLVVVEAWGFLHGPSRFRATRRSLAAGGAA